MTRPKPTDSEQLIQQRIETALAESKKGNSHDDIAHLLWLAQGIDIWHRTSGACGHSLDDAMKYLASSIVRRDQQRLTQAIEIVEAEYQKLRTIGRVMDDGFTHLFIDCDYRPNIKQALTAALGPDNSKTKEKTT